MISYGGKSGNSILEILREEKEAGISGGLYHELQVRMTYHSNHIEGSKSQRSLSIFTLSRMGTAEWGG